MRTSQFYQNSQNKYTHLNDTLVQIINFCFKNKTTEIKYIMFSLISFEINKIADVFFY